MFCSEEMVVLGPDVHSNRQKNDPIERFIERYFEYHHILERDPLSPDETERLPLAA
jgi:hypothetical protein